MDLRFLPRDGRRLDEAAVELCASFIWSDERPVHGLAGLLDWRMGGRLGALLRAGFFAGSRGETLLLPGKPHVPFEKVLVIGLGERPAFDESAFREAVEQTGRALAGLKVRRVALELPGRGAEGIEPERAVALTLESLGGSADHDAWWLIDTPAALRRIELRAADERRRVRVP